MAFCTPQEASLKDIVPSRRAPMLSIRAAFILVFGDVNPTVASRLLMFPGFSEKYAPACASSRSKFAERHFYSPHR